MSFQRVGFIGLGIMGKGMFKNLATKLDPAVEFIIWNRNIDICQDLKSTFSQRQITIASTPAQVVGEANVTFSMLSNLEASMDVFDSEGSGAVSGVSAGKIIVDCATLSPERMIELEQRIKEKGGSFIEAPVSGSKVPAETGQLIFLCGGDANIYGSVLPALDAMGKARFLFGPVGHGSKVKLIVNMIMGSMMVAFSEGLNLGKQLDLPLETLLEVLDLGAMSNPIFRGKGPSMIKDSYVPNFPLKHAQKDMRLAIELAAANHSPVSGAAAANEVFKQALSQDLGDEDFSAVYKAVQNNSSDKH